MIFTRPFFQQITREPVAGQVERLTGQMVAQWWASDTTLPEFGQAHDWRAQREHEQRLGRLLDGLTAGLRRASDDPAARAHLREQALDEGMAFARDAFGFDPAHLAVVRRSGLLEATEAFAQQARRFDPAMPGEDIYQAARNVMTMNFVQLLLGLPVAVTPAVFAYSMLYPYTDNYLDDPAVRLAAKLGFSRRFRERLAGEPVAPYGPAEERIWELVGMVEGQYGRGECPQVYESLLGIHDAQSRSLRQARASASPYELDALRVSFEKGGASVLADGYLAAGDLTSEQAGFLFGYGAFTQLMDDLEDVRSDGRAGSQTIFSQVAGRWPLDGLTNRALHLGAGVFAGMDIFAAPERPALQDLIQRAIPALMAISASNAGSYYTSEYIRVLQARMPVRFSFLRAQQKKLERRKVSLMALVM